jgi:membrane protease YdiL (CAAX protease family)
MSANGSIRRTSLPASLASALVLPGWGAMLLLAGPLVGSLGIRPLLLASELLLVAPAVAVCLLAGVSARDGLGYRPMSRRVAALSLLAGAAFWIASLGLLEVQYSFWKPPEGYLEAFQRLHAALRPANAFDLLLSVAAIAVAPAFFEELLFRGVVLPALLRRLGAVAAVATSAALFGLIHLDVSFVLLGLTRHDLPTLLGALYRVPFALAVGLGFGVLRVRSGSLWPSTLAHAFLNTTTFLIEPLVEDPSATTDPNLWLGAALLGVGLAVSVLLLRSGSVGSIPDREPYRSRDTSD